MRRSVRHAFTLIELLLVIMLLGAILLIAWPDLSGTAKGDRLPASAERFRSLITMCRVDAMNLTTPFRVIFFQDGSVRVRRQADPIRAPHLYITPRVDWARQDVLLPGVWVESVQLMPDGPPPVLIYDEAMHFADMEIEPVRVDELEFPLALEIEPDGTCNSLRWVLRDEEGRALLLTLDGRLGTLTVRDWDAVPVDELTRPAPLPDDAFAEPEYRPEDYE